MSKLTLGQINKLCGRKGIRTYFVKKFLTTLSGNRNTDLENLNSQNYNNNTIKACKDGLSIYYSGEDNNGRPKTI